MALTRKDKEQLVDVYKKDLEGAKSVIVLKQNGIPVNEINKVRMALEEVDAKLNVVKKRVYLKTTQDNGMEGPTLEDFDGSVVVLYSYEDQYAPLKAIANFKKDWKKAKVEFGFDYIGGWIDDAWQDSDFVTTMATMPSKDELMGKFAWLLNYPLQSFAGALDQVAKKGE